MNKLEIQGDVALRPIHELPSGAVKIEHRPLALGEVSGHAHVVTEESYDLFEFEGKTFISIGGDGGFLEHIHLEDLTKADHEAIRLAKNTVYEVILQNEYNPESKAFERVLD